MIQWFKQKIFKYNEPQYKANVGSIDYRTLFTPQNLAMLSDWLSETGELYVDVYHPHSASSSAGYFIRSRDELKILIAKQTHHEIDVTIFREKQFPLRGIADEQLLEQALRMIPNGESYEFVSLELSSFPSNIAIWGSGDSHSEFRKEFAREIGEAIGIGTNPNTYFSKTSEWFEMHPNAVFRATYLRNNGKITRNQDDYEPYNSNPEKYDWVIQLWQSED